MTAVHDARRILQPRELAQIRKPPLVPIGILLVSLVHLGPDESRLRQRRRYVVTSVVRCCGAHQETFMAAVWSFTRPIARDLHRANPKQLPQGNRFVQIP